MHKENRSKSGQEVEGWSEVSTPFLYIVPLAQTTSDASKAVPSSKSAWTLSHRRADSASAAKKVVFSP